MVEARVERAHDEKETGLDGGGGGGAASNCGSKAQQRNEVRTNERFHATHDIPRRSAKFVTDLRSCLM